MAEDDRFDPVATARRLLRTARDGALATLSDGGAPFASLVSAATLQAGEPVLLLSGLAVHTRNLERDPRASLLLADPRSGDPLEGARVTVSGRLERLAAEDPAHAHAHRRFLARHPKAEGYAGFSDFGFWRMSVAAAHLVAGFGRIVSLDAPELLVDVGGAEKLLDSEAGAVAHMNADHRDALALYATRFCGAPEGDWLSTGLDPEGMDLMTRDGGLSARLVFPERVADSAQLRGVLVALAKAAREG